jgi:uncharacterized protein YjbI with pentapeptide repeats
MLGRRSREFPSHKTEPAEFAAKATDLDALRNAVVDAAGVGYGLWFSYLFALLYFAIAAGAVTHRDLLLESPVKLPFLNVELPLKAFFILGPLVFLVVHAYVLLHFLLLAGKVGTFHAELQRQVPEDEKRAQLRRQLPSNIFVQFLGGPREVREGIVGFLLKSVAAISLVAGPIALLVLFQLQFLPYHSPGITWWSRIAVVIDLVLLWLLWPPIARGATALLAWNDLRRVRVTAWLAASLLPLLLVLTVATFPGEWLEENLPTVRLVPTNWDGLWEGERWRLAWSSRNFNLIRISKLISGWVTLHELLVAGEIDYVTRRPKSLWSNVLVLPGFDIGDRINFDAQGKIARSPEMVSLRGRRLENAVFVGARLQKADFTGAQLTRVNLESADLREAKFECDLAGSDPHYSIRFPDRRCAQLQGAWLFYARLQGASLDGAQLQGAFLADARMQGASLDGARLQGAYLLEAELQGAYLRGAQLHGAQLGRAQLQGAYLLEAQLHGTQLGHAQLQGATLDFAQLEGTSLDGAQLRGASLVNVLVWRTKPPARDYLKEAVIRNPMPELNCQSGVCDPKIAYMVLEAGIGTVPDVGRRDAALKRIAPLAKEPYDEDAVSAKDWLDLAAESQRSAETYPEALAELLIKIGCGVDGAPYVISGLIRQSSERFRKKVMQGKKAVQESEIARAFLDEASCPGAQGLSEENKAKLRQMRGPEPPH